MISEDVRSAFVGVEVEEVLVELRRGLSRTRKLDSHYFEVDVL